MDFSKIIGPIIGAWIYSHYGITETYILIALLYIISIIIILPIKIEGINKKSINIITEIKIGIVYLKESKIAGLPLISFDEACKKNAPVDTSFFYCPWVFQS